MKKKTIVCILISAVIFISGISATCWATEQSAISNAAGVIQALNQKTGGIINWRTKPSDIKSLFLHTGEEYIYSNYFYAGNTYFILAVGCDDATDLDVTLYDENGNVVSSDTTTKSWSVVTINPKWTGKFYIKVKMYKAVGGAAHAIMLTGFI